MDLNLISEAFAYSVRKTIEWRHLNSDLTESTLTYLGLAVTNTMYKAL